MKISVRVASYIIEVNNPLMSRGLGDNEKYFIACRITKAVAYDTYDVIVIRVSR